MNFRFASLLAGAALLTACGQPAEESTPAAPAAPAEAPGPAEPAVPAKPADAVALDQEGLRLVSDSGSTRLVAFGTPTADTVAALSSVLGNPADRSTNNDCGAGPTEFVSWPNDLDALFMDGKFSGWSAGSDSGGKIGTMDGLGVGSTRQQLTASLADLKVEETTLGIEFTAGSISGILDKDGLFRQRNDDGSINFADTRLSFGAFGSGRNRDFSPRNAANEMPGRINLSPATRQGFTGHEHLDSLGLIHMNGRVYDHRLGRFLSVDPLIQFPADSQSLNPYSYIMNNPMAGTDPSGYATCDIDSLASCLEEGENTVKNADGTEQTVIVTKKGAHIEPPRESRRLIGVSHAAMASSRICR